MSKSKILFQLSGSIACFKACALISKLVQAGYDVDVVATASALKFVGEATLEGLTGKRVHTDTFESGRYMEHIHLMRSADLIILCPATANTLNKLSTGIGDDLLSTMFLAHDFKKPYLIVPAMNQFMFSHPTTQASISKLKDFGLQVLETNAGNLACGEVGEGRMLEPEQIFAKIESVLGNEAKSETTTRHILITSGGTTEAIDGVRAISNTSTGRTGAQLAEWFAGSGDHVTLLHAKTAILPKNLRNIRLVSYTSFADLERELKTSLAAQSFDCLFHLAAVADYSVHTVEANGSAFAAPLKTKIDSGEELVLKLKKNPKLIDSVRKLAKNPNMKIVAFKLTSTNSAEEQLRAVESLAAHANADYIVHNEASEVTGDHHPFAIFDGKGTTRVANPEGAQGLAFALDQVLGGNL